MSVIKKVKGISYDDVEDQDIIEYLDEKDNFSRYILNLIRNDIIQNNKIQVVVDYLYTNAIQGQTSSKNLIRSTATTNPIPKPNM